MNSTLSGGTTPGPIQWCPGGRPIPAAYPLNYTVGLVLTMGTYTLVRIRCVVQWSARRGEPDDSKGYIAYAAV